MSKLSVKSKEKLQPKGFTGTKKVSIARAKYSDKSQRGSSLGLANQGDSHQSDSVKAKFIKMRSETQGPKDIQENDRDGRINFALDMVAHDLVCQGHVNPSKAAYMLKSDEMKERIGRLCDEMTQRRKAEFKTDKPKSRYLKQKEIFKPNSEKVQKLSSIIFPHGIFGNAMNLSNSKSAKSQISEENSTADMFLKIDSKNTTQIITKKSSTLKKSKESGILGNKSKPVEGDLKKKAAKQNSNSEISPEKHLDALLNYPPSFQNLKADFVPFRTRIDLAGFSNSNISIDLNGRRLVVVGFRPRDTFNHARKVTEMIDVPVRVCLENLVITRRKNGALIVQEILPSAEADKRAQQTQS